MYHISKVMQGIACYIDNEIVIKLNGWGKWIGGAGAGVMLHKADHILHSLKENSIVQMLELIDENDNVDVELMYQELRKQAEKGSINIEIPLLGVLTLDHNDVDKLYEYIKRD